MRTYGTIVFDLGNVLLSFDYTPFIEKLESYKPGLGKKAMATYKENYHVHRRFEAGLISEKEFLDIMMQWTEGAVTEEIFCKIFSDIFTENKETTFLLPLLKKKYKLVLLSNTNSIHKRYGWENYSFLKYFDKLCLSHEIGAVKPEEKIYRAVELFTGLPSGEHIFIDDIIEYADGARKIGWDAIHYTSPDNLKLEFNKRGIL